jgi:hypothetical protein
MIGGISGSDTNDIFYTWLDPSSGAACLPSNHATCTGTVFAQQTSAFINPRDSLSSVVYNGDLYIIGGYDGFNYLNDIQYCPLNANGSVASCIQQTNAFTTGRNYLSSGIANGYLYITGGCSASTCGYLNDIQRMWVGQMGQVGATTQQTSAFTTLRTWHSSVVYNGYLYIIGGNAANSATGCDSTGHCSDIQFCPLNTDGSVGTCHYTENGNDDNTSFVAGAFAVGRFGHTSVLYNGYVYIIGGRAANSATGCDSNGYCNDIQFCPLNTNGTVGTCHYTHAGTDDGTSYVAGGFTTARSGFTSVVDKGYLYIIGGSHAGLNTSCNTVSSIYCNDIQFCPLNTNGTVGTCHYTHAGTDDGTSYVTASFTGARNLHSSVVYNDYLYIIGGTTDVSNQMDIQYCPINGNGTVGSCTDQLGAFTTARNSHSSVVYNGNLYIIGGSGADDIQYCPLSSSGWAGTCSKISAAFTTGRWNHTSIIYNGYLYIAGGQGTGTGCTSNKCNDIQYLPLSATALRAPYERVVDVGSTPGTLIQSLVYNGSATCGAQLMYATAGSNGVFGSFTTIPQALAGTTYSINAASKRYILIKVVMDDSVCGATSNITDVTVNYVIPPDSPTLITPASGVTGITTLTPAFTFRSADALNDNLQYMVQVCSDISCSSPLKIACQITSTSPSCTGSQTGWSGQDQGGGTAYTGNAVITSSTIATYTYSGSPALSWGTTYYWRAWAYDPSQTTWSINPSSIQSFTTSYQPTAPTLSKPSNTETGLSTTPELRFYSTDQDNDTLMYKILICANSDSTCSSPLQTILQTSSQVGWTSQSQSSGTKYASGQTAVYTVQTALSANTQYYWQVFAIDTSGTNTYSTGSSIQSFTTAAAAKPVVNIGGGTSIYSGTTIGN